jgi:N-acyl homoserine lactone hydrolase
MKTYSVRPIALCVGPRDLSQYTFGMNFGKKCESVWYTWYVEDSEPRTLIDTGAFRSQDMKVLGSVEKGLARLGTRPEDIRIVIVTHLHFDHIALGYLYKNAKFIVQKKELEYALNPHPLDAGYYDRNTFENLNIELIEGEKEILNGVSVFPTPGHTPGGQSVDIRTESGKVIVAGFCSELATFEQTEEMKKRNWEVSAPLIHQDVRQVYDSVLKVKRFGGTIIAMHDPAFRLKDRIT